MIKKSITLKGHRTSIALEAEFWDALEIIADQKRCSLPALINQIDRNRLKIDPAPGLASAIRVYILRNSTQRD
ncbi:ribbon-helix-helix domain-containing protein [Hyphococcus sp. DH-69]|uniref:ribbon-helix-helix domain-containing protein n=1 Tax=Hyphococcus formosus TaxID=3143534 RepID=UPI00398AD8B7